MQGPRVTRTSFNLFSLWARISKDDYASLPHHVYTHVNRHGQRFRILTFAEFLIRRGVLPRACQPIDSLAFPDNAVTPFHFIGHSIRLQVSRKLAPHFMLIIRFPSP